MTSPVAVSFLTSKRRPVSLVFPPAPSMLWSSVWPYTLKVLNSWIPGAVPVISSCNDQVKEGRPLSDWSKPWTWWWPSDSQPGVRWRTCPQQSCQWCPPCTWSCSQWRGSGRSWRCRSDSGLGRGWWWRPPSTRTRPALSGRPRSWWDIWRSAPPGGSCPGSWSWPLVPAQGPPWGRARAPLAVRSTGCRNGGGRLRQPPRELGVATWEGKSLGWGILAAQGTYMSDSVYCPLKTGELGWSVWPGKLCPDPRLTCQPLYVGQRSDKQRPAPPNPLSPISCPAYCCQVDSAHPADVVLL